MGHSLLVFLLVVVVVLQGGCGQLTCPFGAPKGKAVSIGKDFVSGVGGRDPGECNVYPIGEANVCAKYFGGTMHYIPKTDGKRNQNDRRDFQAVDYRVETLMNYLDSASLSESCYSVYSRYLCATVYPPCVEDANGTWIPQKLNIDVCEFIRASKMEGGCSELVQNIQTLSDGFEPIQICDENALISDTFPQYFFQPSSWDNTPVWESIPGTGLTLDALKIAGNELQCVSPQIKVTGRVAPGVVTCEFPCEFPLYSSGEWLRMRLALVIPGLLAIPFNLVALRNALKRKRTVGVNVLYILGLVMALCYSFLICLPAAILGSEIGCSSSSASDGHRDSIMCWITKTAPFILQVFANSVAASLYLVFRRTKAAKELRSYRSKKREHVVLFGYAVCTPLALMIVAFVLDAQSSSESEYQFSYLVRNSFICLPRLENSLHEFLLIHGPLFMAGFLSFVFSVVIASYIYGSGSEYMSSRVRFFCCCCFGIADRVQQERADSAILGAFQDRTVDGNGDIEQRNNSSATSKGSKGSKSSKGSKWLAANSVEDAMMTQVILQMLRYAFVSFLCVVIELVSAIAFYPSLKEFQTEVFRTYDCAANGGFLQCQESANLLGTYEPIECCGGCQYQDFVDAYPDLCPDCSSATPVQSLFTGEFTPSVSTLVLFYLSWSCLPLFFGFVFAFQTLVRTIRYSKKNVKNRFGSLRRFRSPQQQQQQQVTNGAIQMQTIDLVSEDDLIITTKDETGMEEEPMSI